MKKVDSNFSSLLSDFGDNYESEFREGFVFSNNQNFQKPDRNIELLQEKSGIKYEKHLNNNSKLQQPGTEFIDKNGFLQKIISNFHSNQNTTSSAINTPKNLTNTNQKTEITNISQNNLQNIPKTEKL